MANYYCEYCGTKASNVTSLTAGSCIRHPNGANKGKHKLYEGSEKSQYVCKYCGTKSTSLMSLTTGSCIRHPNGANKGKHSPAL
jgi:DNA-directed RNA polymerase subunit RPC12/RpoP